MMIKAAEQRVPKLLLKLVFDFFENLFTNSLCWMAAISARF